jgi:kynurenine formamidase
MKKHRTRILILFLLMARTCPPCFPQSGREFPQGRIVDLTYAFDEQTIFWPTEKGFVLENESRGLTDKGYFYTANRFSSAEHGGTHIDAPIHFFKDRNTLEAIPIEQLIGKGTLIDVSVKCAADRDYQVQVNDFLNWERKHGTKLNGIILLRTGFGKFWPNRTKYLGTGEHGAQAVTKLHFPGLHPEAARWLITNRSVTAVGLDTASIDYGQSTHFQSHVTLFEKNIPALENVANLDQLPERDFTVIALPMKIKGGSGGPVRIVAVVQ